MSTQTPSRSTDQRTDTSAPTREMASTQNIPTRNMQPGMQDTQAGIRDRDRMDDGRRGRMPGNETKPAYKTTELYIYLAAVGGTLLAAELVGRNSVGVDVFRADNAWFLITLLTIAYLGSRGLAKLGNSWRRSER